MPGLKHGLAAVFAAAMLLWSVPSSAQQQQSMLETVKQRGTIFVGMRNDYPPLSYIDEKGNWVGMEVELIQYMANKLGVKLNQVVVSGATRLPLLVNGNIDLLSGSMIPTPDRALVVDFIQPFFYDHEVILTRKADNISSIQDLAAPKTIATAAGGYTSQSVLKVQPKAKLALFQDWSQAIQALISGHANGVAVGETVVAQLLKDAPHPELVVGPAFRDDPYVMAVRKNDSRWRLFIELTTMEAWTDGTIQRLYEKYLGKKPTYQVLTWWTIDDAGKPGFWEKK